MEYLGDCGGHVELDHRLGDLVILLHALAPDDKRSLDLIVGVTTVTGSLMAMVRGQDDNTVIIYSGLLDRVHNPLHTAVDSGQLSIVLIRSLAKRVAGMVKSINVDKAEHRFFLNDILGALLNYGLRMARRVIDGFLIANALEIHIVADITPLADDSSLGIRPLLPI